MDIPDKLSARAHGKPPTSLNPRCLIATRQSSHTSAKRAARNMVLISIHPLRSCHLETSFCLYGRIPTRLFSVQYVCYQISPRWFQLEKKKSVLTKVCGKLLNQNPGNLGWDRGFGAPQNQAWRFWLAMGGVKGKKGGIRYSWRWGFGIIITSSLCTVLSTPCDLSLDAILFT